MLETFTPVDDKRDNIIPNFHMKAVKNEFRSQQEGREIWEEAEYVEMIVPGDKNSVVDVKVKDEHRERWPARYEAFKKSKEMPDDGTPLEEWAGVSRSQVMELKSSHVRTVEHLAGLSDSQLAKVCPMGGHILREKAKAFLQQSEEQKPLAEALAQIEALRSEIAAMKVQTNA
jgi:hypothetical protein